MKNTIALNKLDDMNKESVLSYLRLLYKDVIALNNGEYLVCDNSSFNKLNSNNTFRYSQDKTTVMLLDKDLHEIVRTSGYIDGNELNLWNVMDYSTGIEVYMVYERIKGGSSVKKLMFQDGRVIDLGGIEIHSIASSFTSIVHNQSDNTVINLYQLDSYIRDAEKRREYPNSILMHINSELNLDGTCKCAVCDSNVQDYYKFLTIGSNGDKHLLLLTIPACKIIDYNIDKDAIDSIKDTDYDKNSSIENILQAFLKDHNNIVRHTNDMIGQLSDTYINSKNMVVGHDDTVRRMLVDETSRSFEMLDINNRVCMIDKKNIVASDNSLLMPFNKYIMSIGSENARNMDKYRLLNKDGDLVLPDVEINDDIAESNVNWTSLSGTDYYIKITGSMYIYNSGRYTTDRKVEIYKDIDNKIVKLYETGKNYSNLYKISKESSFTIVNDNVAFVMHMSDVGPHELVKYIQVFYPELSLVVSYKAIDDSVEDIMMDGLDESVNGSKSVDYEAYEAYKLNGLDDFDEPDIDDYNICRLEGYNIKYFNTAGTMLSTDRIGIKAYSTNAMSAVVDFGNIENEIIGRIDRA